MIGDAAPRVGFAREPDREKPGWLGRQRRSPESSRTTFLVIAKTGGIPAVGWPDGDRYGVRGYVSSMGEGGREGQQEGIGLGKVTERGDHGGMIEGGNMAPWVIWLAVLSWG